MIEKFEHSIVSDACIFEERGFGHDLMTAG